MWRSQGGEWQPCGRIADRRLFDAIRYGLLVAFLVARTRLSGTSDHWCMRVQCAARASQFFAYARVFTLLDPFTQSNDVCRCLSVDLFAARCFLISNVAHGRWQTPVNLD